MSEADGHALLEEIGVACPASMLAHSAREANQAALALGGAVVLKVQSPDVLHKSDVGAIALGVQPDDAQTAYDALVSRVREGVPTAAIQGVLVQEQVDTGVELLVGLQAASGGYAPVLTVGIGGTAVEMLPRHRQRPCARDSRAGARVVANTSRLAAARRVPRW